MNLQSVFWVVCIFVNFFAASINSQVGNESGVIFNLVVGVVCVIMLSANLINNGFEHDYNRKKSKKNNKKDSI